MNRLLTTAVTAATLLGAAPAWACLPPPPNASYETAMARAAFVGRVVSVERSDPADCLAAARARVAAGAVMQGDPGERGCEAFGFATLEPAWIITGEDVVTGSFRIAWNKAPFCSIGWTPEVGALAVALVPDDASRLRDGTTATVEPIQQGDALFRTILELVAEIQP
ncbi:hypothetical protein MMB232_03238 [Brevundimonas subvibrioides]|uniref:hypothetical protein n=1 Tax=Brevundimonas subvibrioides TaxID=74313 RepID=UPI0032D577FD